jgi:hypothetical protein
MANSKERDQLSVPIDAALRAELEARARAERRTVANMVRYLLVKALDQDQVAA